MKEITIYQCEDGSRFESMEDAKNYEGLCERISKIMSPMGERTRDCRIGAVYISHDPSLVKGVLKNFLLECSKYLPRHSNDFIECANGIRSFTHAGYIIMDCGIKVLSDVLFRFSCTNIDNGREYSHPYYTTHEEEFIEQQQKYFSNQNINYKHN